MTKEEKKQERDAFRKMTPKEKWRHLRSYYLLPATAAVLGIAAAVFLIWHMGKPGERSGLNVVVVDAALKENAFAASGDGTGENGTGRTAVSVRDGFRSDSEEDLSALSVLMFNHSVDLIIAPEPVWKELAEEGCFQDLNRALDSSLRANWADRILRVRGYQDESLPDGGDGTGMGTEAPYGIRLDGSERWKAGVEYASEGRPVAGLVLDAPNTAHAVTFLGGLLGDGADSGADASVSPD